MSLAALSIVDVARDIRDGRITSAELVEDCLKRIAEVDPGIDAWTFLNPDHARAQAETLDENRRHGRSLGPLHGVPIGVKDIFDTADMPTEFGCPYWAGRTPRSDAAAVARLRAAGAVIMGKTVTTEYAYFQPGKTKNPHNPDRTPGGSSSGSAAAVASHMVPGAIGSQTNGSVIRPAAFCGVVGFKPTHGLISRAGALTLSRHLDHVGVFGRTVEDAALLAEVLVGFDEEDPDTRPVASPPFLDTARSEPPLPPRFAFLTSPIFEQAEPATREGFAELTGELGDAAAEVSLGSRFAGAVDMQKTVMETEMAHNLGRDYDKIGDGLSERLRQLIERGRKITAVEYLAARDAAGPLNLALDEIFNEYDAILTPAAPGAARGGKRPAIRSFARCGAISARPQSRCRCWRPRTGCRSASSSSDAAETMHASCARRAGWSRP